MGHVFLQMQPEYGGGRRVENFLSWLYFPSYVGPIGPIFFADLAQTGYSSE
jgi:hypothetical protein